MPPTGNLLRSLLPYWVPWFLPLSSTSQVHGRCAFSHLPSIKFLLPLSLLPQPDHIECSQVLTTEVHALSQPIPTNNGGSHPHFIDEAWTAS